MFEHGTRSGVSAVDESTSLPAWLYTDPEFFEVEKEAIFRPPGRSSAISTTCRIPATITPSISSAR